MSTRRRTTATQLRVLLDYMNANPSFAVSEFTGPQGTRQLEKGWAELTAILANYGPQKTVEQWKHTWRDLKKRAQAEGGKLKLAHRDTGNIGSLPVLSDQSEKKLNIIGHECAIGITDGEETGLGDDSIVIPSPTKFIDGSYNEPQPELPQHELPQPGPSSSGSRKTQLRKRVVSNALRFVEKQEQANKISEEIRDELKRSNDLWIQLLSILQVIADKLQRFGPHSNTD